MVNNTNLEGKSSGLGYARLAAVAIGATIGGGVFSLAGDMAANGANTAAVIVGWIICGIGMLALTMCFFGLNKIKPHLTGGIYSYANEGWGDYVGFNSAWGYWISALLANVSYATLLFAAIAYFIPIFGTGNNIWSIVCASLVIWFMNYLVLRGVKEAAGINLVVTISKVIPILVFIVAVMFIKAFDPAIFMANFWGESGGLSFVEQVKATSGTTVWAFIGIEGAVVISGRAKRSKDVGKATITAFLSVIAIYIMVSMLSVGVMPRAELAELGNPPMAAILASVVGPWGAALVNIGVIISLAGATLGYTIIASECPYLAAKNGVFSKSFAKENKNGAPVNALFLTNGIIQLFLIITYLNESTYQIFYTISASMIMIPYLLSAMYYLLIAFRKDGFVGESTKTINMARFIGILGTIYGCWLIYASGLTGLLITAILYVPGTLVYIKAKKEKGEKCFETSKDKIILGIIVAMAILSLILIFNGTITPF
jgi:arginine:ornithine antiporter/lysine permease